MDESGWHGRVGGCSWKFAGILCRNFASSAADFSRVAFGHSAECWGVRRNLRSGAGGGTRGIAGGTEVAVWN